jgi:hypothetical protein
LYRALIVELDATRNFVNRQNFQITFSLPLVQNVGFFLPALTLHLEQHLSATENRSDALQRDLWYRGCRRRGRWRRIFKAENVALNNSSIRIGVVRYPVCGVCHHESHQTPQRYLYTRLHGPKYSVSHLKHHLEVFVAKRLPEIVHTLSRA